MNDLTTLYPDDVLISPAAEPAAPELPAAEPPPAAPPPDMPRMSAEDKARLFGQRSTLAGIRKVARSRLVPRAHMNDVVQQTIILAWKGRLPVAPDEARKVVNRIASLVSTQVVRPPLLGVPVNLEDVVGRELASHAADPAPDIELRDEVQHLLDKARARFPRRFEAFMASVLGRYPSQAEADERGVTDAQVRKERSEVRAFMRLHGQKMGLLVAATMVLLVFGSMRGWGRDSYVERSGDWNTWTPSHREAFRPAADAASLRALAARRYRDNDYEACLRDLDAAKAIDGRADTENEAHMRAISEHELRTEDAKYPMPVK